MKTSIYILSLCLTVLLSSSCSSEKFKTVKVEFCADSNRGRIVPAQFETVTEELLKKDAYNEGATFETVTEQVLEKDAYNTLRQIPATTVVVVGDAETGMTTSLFCCNDPYQTETVNVPTVYTTYSYQKLIENGTGNLVDATYNTRSYLKLVNDAHIDTTVNNPAWLIEKTFVIPEDSNFETYWEQQIASNFTHDCVFEITYQVVE